MKAPKEDAVKSLSRSQLGSQKSQGTPNPVLGDFASQGDIRHPLHYQPLRKVGGPQNKDVIAHTTPNNRNVVAEVYDLDRKAGESHFD